MTGDECAGECRPGATATKPIAAEELFAMGDIGRCELIAGEIVRMTLAGAEHGDVALEIGRQVATHVKAHRLGKLDAAETGSVIRRRQPGREVP